MSTAVTSSLSGEIVLLPWGLGSADGDAWAREAIEEVRCHIEQLDGKVAYAQPPKRPYAPYGEEPGRATMEYVPEGEEPTTQLPVLSEADLKARIKLALGAFAAFLAPLARPAYVPVVAETAAPGTESRYFGRPWMPDDMAWPELDGEPMQFVLQLDCAALPAPFATEPGRTRLLLFFHASEYDEQRQSCVVAVDPAAGPGGLRATPDGVHENPPLAIVRWREVVDHPDSETLSGIEGFDLFEGVYESASSHTYGKLTDENGVDHPEKEAVEKGIRAIWHCFQCDKLGGWPDFEQGDDTPTDSNGKRMEFLMQVGHEGLVLGGVAEEIEWPTWGRGQIFVSPGTGELKYVWACD